MGSGRILGQRQTVAYVDEAHFFTAALERPLDLEFLRGGAR